MLFIYHVLIPYVPCPRVPTFSPPTYPRPRVPESPSPHNTRPRDPSLQVQRPRPTLSHSQLLVSLRKCFHRKHSLSVFSLARDLKFFNPNGRFCRLFHIRCSRSKAQVSRDSIWQIIKLSTEDRSFHSQVLCHFFPLFFRAVGFFKYKRGHIFS